MPLCTYSNDYDAKNYTLLENRFITDYLPIMDPDDVKVYLLGLYLCNNALGEENNLKGLCDGSGLNETTVKKSFEKLQKFGLVTVVSTAPLSVRFNSPSKAIPQVRTFNVDKYSDFCASIQRLYPNDDLTQNDLYSYIDFLEDSKMDQQAFIMVTKYCFDLNNPKQKRIGRNYILQVARSWVEDGVLTVAQAENRLYQIDAVAGDIKKVLHSLKSKREPDADDREYYLKWLKIGFTLDAILAAAKRIKRGGMPALDELLTDFSEQGVYTEQDVKAYTQRKENIDACTQKILQNLGLRYQDYSAISEENVAPLFQKGFTSEGLQKISRYCRMIGIRDLAGFEKTVDDFYRGGYISEYSIDLQLNALTKFDQNVQDVVYATGSARKISAQDRDLYRTWSVTWGIDENVILQFARESQGNPYAMSLLSKRLAEYKESKAFEPQKIQSTVREKQQQGSLSEFEKAEIREKLTEDAEYSRLTTIKKKLDFEMSEYLFGDKTVPINMQKTYDDVQNQINARIVELGYKVEDLQ